MASPVDTLVNEQSSEASKLINQGQWTDEEH